MSNETVETLLVKYWTVLQVNERPALRLTLVLKAHCSSEVAKQVVYFFLFFRFL